MMQLGDNRMWQLYPMDSLPVLWRIGSNLGADTAHTNVYFSGKTASPLDRAKKSGIGRKKELKALANYVQVRIL